MRHLRKATAPYPKAALFELFAEGHTSVFEILAACIISIRTRDETTLPVARALFARARTPARVAALSVAQIDTLKEELAEARRSFAAEMADAQREFMAQMRELTASIRPQQAEQPAPARQRQQWPSWSKKPFSELSSAERTAMEKTLASEIEKGRQQQGLRLSDFHKIVNDRWKEQQARTPDQDSGPKPKKP